MADPSVIERNERDTRLSKPIVCEFCECQVSMRGRVLKRSDKAKAIIDLDDEADRLRKQVETLTAEIAELKKVPEPAPGPAPVKKRWSSIGDDEDDE